jgi:hypothetical protein
MLENRNLSYVDGPIPVPLDDPFLTENVERICIGDTGKFPSSVSSVGLLVTEILERNDSLCSTVLIECHIFC